MEFTDLIRAIVVGQLALTTGLMFCYAGLVLHYHMCGATDEGLKPGTLLGLSFVLTAHGSALTIVADEMIDRFGLQPTWRLYVGGYAAVAGGLGFAFLCAHMLFHNPKFLKKVERFFKKSEKSGT